MLLAMVAVVLLGCASGTVNCVDVSYRLVRSLGPKVIKSLLSKDSRTSEGRAESLISTFSAELVKHLPSSVEAPAIDLTLDLGYACSAPGITSGLDSMKKTDKIGFSKNKDGSKNVSIRYHFDTLKISYNKFVFKYGFAREMEIELIPKRNTLLLELHIKRTSSIFKRVIRKTCMVYVTRVEFTDVGDLQVDVKTPKTHERDFLKPIVEKMFQSNSEIVRNCMNESVNVRFYSALRSSRSLLCRGEALESVVLDKYALVIAPLPMSEEYERQCG